MNLDKLEIEITAASGSATDSINKLISSMDKLKGAASGTTKINVDTKDVKKAENRVGKLTELLSSMKRIAMYRAVRSAIKAVTEAIKEGLENAYEYSKLMGGSLASALDRIASKSQKLKNQIGAAVGELIEGLEPVLSDVFDEATEIAKTLTSLFAMVGSAIRTIYTLLKPVIDFALDALSAIMSGLRVIFDYIAKMLGSDGYLVANDVSKAWDEANKSAKEYKRTLIGIDEINRLNDTPDVGSMFSTAPNFDNKAVDEAAEKLKELTAWPDDDYNNRLKGVAEALEEIAAAAARIVFPAINTEPAIISVRALESELQAVPNYVPSLAFNPVPSEVTESVSALEQALAGMREVLIPLLEKFPVALTFQVASPVEALGVIAEYLSSTFFPLLLEHFPYVLSFQVESPVPAMEEATQSALVTLETFSENVSSLWESVVSATTEAAENYEQAMAQIEASHAALDSKIDAYIQHWAENFETLAEKVSSFAERYEESKKKTEQIHEEWNASIDKNLKTSYDNFVSWAEDVYKKVTEKFKQLSDAINSIVQKISSAFNSLKSNFQANGGLSELLTGNNRTAATKSWGISGATTAGTIITGAALSGGLSLIPAFAGAFASGGYVDSGELFLAREGGAELVGSIGGHTGVANNDQIVEGISEGVAYANVGVVAAINQLIGVVQQIDPTVELDGLTVSRGLKKYERQVNREYGHSLVAEVAT